MNSLPDNIQRMVEIMMDKRERGCVRDQYAVQLTDILKNVQRAIDSYKKEKNENRSSN